MMLVHRLCLIAFGYILSNFNNGSFFALASILLGWAIGESLVSMFTGPGAEQ